MTDNLKTFIQFVTEDVTEDEHHTMDELYMHRMALTSALFKYIDGYKSLLHEDGTMYDDMFIVWSFINDKIISYHYDIKYWNNFENCEILKHAPKFDGHTPDDVVQRLLSLSVDSK